MSSRITCLCLVGGLVAGFGCGEPRIGPVMPPGVDAPRAVPITAGAGAEAIGEGGAGAAKTAPVSTVINEPSAIGEIRKTNSSLAYETLKEGNGPSCKPGQTVKVNYVGQLAGGEKFDASADHGGPMEIQIGVGRVIKGWDEGIPGMKVGEKRRLLIPASLGYGSAGSGTKIPPNSDLVFEVELLDAH